MAAPSRTLPYAGMPVRIMHFGSEEPATVEEVRDDGRTLIVAGQVFTLRQVGAQYVREGEPSYGTRLAFSDAPAEAACG